MIHATTSRGEMSASFQDLYANMGKPCRQEINDQWRSFFCCDEPKEKKCNFFIWFDVFMRPGTMLLQSKIKYFVNTILMILNENETVVNKKHFEVNAL